MIVECKKCHSKFNLDETVIGDEGSKVRCSSCKDVFVVYPPEPDPDFDGPGDEQGLDDELEETIALEKRPSMEDLKQAPPSEEEEDFDRVFEEAMEEEIKEGGDEALSETDDLKEPEEVETLLKGDLLGEEEPLDDEEAIPLDEVQDAEEKRPEELLEDEEIEKASDESTSLDEFPELEDQDSDILEELLDDQDAAPTSLEEKDTDEEISLDEFPELDEDTVRDTGEESRETVGSLTDTDKDEDGVEPITPEELPDLETADTVDMDEAMERAAEIEDEVTQEDAEDREADSLGERSEAPAPEKTKRFPIWSVILVIVLILLGGTAAVILFAPNLFQKPIDRGQIEDTGVRRLAFQAVNGSFVQTVRGKQRFIIKGRVINQYPMSRSFILIKGAILDDKGQVLRRMMVYSGNTFTDKQLKEWTLEEIKKVLKNRFGKGKVNVNIKSGGKIPFMIIFEDLPENMSEFTVEAVSSSQGQ